MCYNTFHSHCQVWVKCGVIYICLMPLGVREFVKIYPDWAAVFLLNFSYTSAVKRFEVNIRNGLVQRVCHVTVCHCNIVVEPKHLLLLFSQSGVWFYPEPFGLIPYPPTICLISILVLSCYTVMPAFRFCVCMLMYLIISDVSVLYPASVGLDLVRFVESCGISALCSMYFPLAPAWIEWRILKAF